MATDFDWAGFRALAKRLDDLVAGERNDERDDEQFAEDLRRAITFVYTAGVTMPSAGDVYEDAGGDEFWNGTEVPGLAPGKDVADDLTAAETLAARIAESVEAAQPDALGDPEEIADVATSAAENLLDAVARISAGSELFDAKRLREAQWEWSFGFDDWGSNAIAALAALHELLWGAR
ncbi:MAG TPA: DUF5063 domain-containing protein [Coriobacteriia bacterium]